MKRKLKNWIINNYFRNLIFQYLLNVLNYSSRNKLICQENELFSYNEYKNYIKPFYFQPVIDNNFFGIGSSLNQYCGLPKSKTIRFYIEHGYFFGPYISEDSKNYWCKKVITFGLKRNNYLASYDFEKVIQIGPYIHYAENYIDEHKFNLFKKELGKVLLVFPMHASTGTELEFDVLNFFNFIDNVKSDYDTVIVSLFWTDLENDVIISECKIRKYKIFCAGNRFSQDFLSRLKIILRLSDMTISNGVGTHVIYSVYLKKPHFIYEQNIKEKAFSNKGLLELSIYNKEEYNIRKNEMQEITDLFGDNFSKELTKEQYSFCYKRFGFDKIKTPEELLEILEK